MIVDCHVHVCACTPMHGSMSARLQNSLAFRFMRWRLKLKGYDADTEAQFRRRLLDVVDGTPKLDAAVVLAFDAVHDDDGRLDEANTHFYVTNDYIMELARRHPKILFGASVHPYRKDAVAEIERCVRGGAVLLKWLPITQNFDPSDERCIPVYEALAHLRLPLLSHTGGEKSLPTLNPHVADPMLLVPALQRGVTVIAAHCGTRSAAGERDFVPHFIRLAQEYENCYGDTSALNLPTRSYAWDKVLRHPIVHRKLVHGSDWPIPVFPPLGQLDLATCVRLVRDANWLRRDVAIKERLGLPDDYWHRGATLLRKTQEGFREVSHVRPAGG
jgi:predicted TIM-barrel fold metal-dependent hydrolase